MPREQFFNDPSDVEWLRETHLKHFGVCQGTTLTRSFILIGNEDCPERVLCYLHENPSVAARPFVIYRFNSETRLLEQE
jgi:hypothetical protein